MAYKYHKVDNGYLRNTNRLRWVEDTPGFDDVETTDIDNQERDNYEYDDIGNLISDADEKIARIEWNVYGKVNSVIRADGSDAQDLYFSYDASGNRIAKKAVSGTGSSTITYYLRDASGNVMATYKKEGTAEAALEEQHIYGSSRVGMYKSSQATTEAIADRVVKGKHLVGLRSYELTDHLGNVHVVLSDLKKADNNVLKSEVRAAYEYYPFGMMMQKYEGESYRYGFNGMEKDDEAKGSGNGYTTEFRQYDPRLGRWLSIDPAVKKYPMQTPYAAFNNNPIYFIDPFGDDPPTTFEKHSGIDGSEVYLPTGSCTDVNSDGQVTRFEAGNKTFDARYDANGKFSGYFDFDNNQYQNPDIEVSDGGFSDSGDNIGSLGKMEITFAVTGIPASGLDIIQLDYSTAYAKNSPTRARLLAKGVKFYSSGSAEGLIRGQFIYTDPNGKKFNGEVDGGNQSTHAIESGGPTDPNGPYYIGYGTPVQVGGMVWNNETNSGTVTASDSPGQRGEIGTIKFTTIIVARNYMNSGNDVVIGVYNWGFTNYGKTPLHGETIQLNSGKLTQTDIDVIKRYYPNYTFY